MSDSPIQIHLAAGDCFSVSTPKKDKWLFTFTPIGSKSKRNPNSMDALAKISTFSKAELFLLSVINSTIQKDNTVIIKKSNYAAKEARQLDYAIPSWISKKLLIREIKEHYIVSPYFIVPALNNQELIKLKWDALS